MKLANKFTLGAGFFAIACAPAPAAEIAILRNGSSIRHERHEARENKTRLYLSETSDDYADVLTAEIVGFEKVEPPLRPAAMLRARPNLEDVITALSSENNIDPDLIHSVIRAESGFHPKAISPKGAQGLMQLMPETASYLGVDDVMDPEANVKGGSRYLRELLSRYHNDLIKALAAYNAGPERVEQYHGVPPYPETIAFISRVVDDFNRRKLPKSRSRTNGRNERKPDRKTERLNAGRASECCAKYPVGQ